MNLPENVFDLGPILTKSTQGPMIVDYYYKQKHLNESCRGNHYRGKFLKSLRPYKYL